MRHGERHKFFNQRAVPGFLSWQCLVSIPFGFSSLCLVFKTALGLATDWRTYLNWILVSTRD